MTNTPRADSSTGIVSQASLTPRERKAIDLIDAGAVTLNLDGTATVRGTGRAVYVVTKTGCACPDYQKRGADLGDPGFLCKHREAVKALCTVYRLCQREARETGRVRLPANLAKALPRGAAAAPAPKASVDDLLGDLFVPSDLDAVPAGALTDDRGVAYCHDCGADLDDNGRCPDRDWVERGDLDDEHDLLSRDLDSDPYEGDWDEAAA